MLPVYVVMTLLVMVSVASRFEPDLAAQTKVRTGRLPQIAAQQGGDTAPTTPYTFQGCHADDVFDGDTLELICGTKAIRARLVGFDAPETHPSRCPAEAALGGRAKERLRGLASGAGVEYQDMGHDKYGRDLVFMRVGGRDVAAVMIAEGLAVAYDGATRIDWCARLAGG